MSSLLPRILQIFSLLSLLLFGAISRDLSFEIGHLIAVFSSGILTQLFFLRVFRVPGRGVLSALVTSCGVALLLRSNFIWVSALAASIGIASKFLIRFKSKHLFNPANFGVLFAICLFPGAWVSAGQWGSDVALVFLLIVLGNIVIFRSRHMLMSWAFLFFFLSITGAYRVLYLGYEWQVWIHQLSNGAFLLFVFFMISDPRTAPNSDTAKVFHALLISILAIVSQFYLYNNNSLLWALALASPLVPFWDRVLPADRYDWSSLTKNTINNEVRLRKSSPAGGIT